VSRSRSFVVLLAALALSGCVLWPEGEGPRAAPMPLREALARRDKGEVVFVDVRSTGAWAAGHIPGALSIPESQITGRVAEIRRLRKLPVLYCG
jgi:hypothetical protein